MKNENENTIDDNELNFQVFNCKRCNHKWLPRTKSIRQCPKCKSYYWAEVKKIKKTKINKINK
jgi:Zn finger protein HypA/HybF involved in hydrogenase expression